MERIDAWTPEAQAGLGATLGPDAAILRRQVEAREAQLWHFRGCWAITRLETDHTDRELVVCCLSGRDCKLMLACLIAYAHANGARTLRYHTPNRALPRLARRWGLVSRELERGVYQVDLGEP